MQFNDGLFPSGAFAHSLGLESYVAEGVIPDAGSVASFVRAHLFSLTATSDAPALRQARRLGAQGNLPDLIALDEELDALKKVPELVAASRQMGRQTLRVAARLGCAPMLAGFQRACEEDRAFGHHPIVLGLIGAVFDLPEQEAVAAYLFSSASLLVGAATRLLPLGQLEAQRLLFELRPLLHELTEKVMADGGDFLHGFAPLLEVAAARHERLSPRLFRS